MKKALTLLMGIALGSVASLAQNFITISGNSFTVDLDNRNMTASIVDYDHQIDDAKFPIKIHKRKFKYLSGTNAVLEIPEVVKVQGREYRNTSIGRAAFADYTNFQYVQIPSSVISIGEYAFFRTNLIDVTIPGSVLTVGDRAFGQCKKLKRLNLPTTVTMGDRVYAESDPTIRRFDGSTQTLAEGSGNTKKSSQGANQVDWVLSDVDDVPNSSLVSENTFVVIIANEDYENDPAVQFAIQDGRSFRIYCEQVLGVPTANIRMKENASYNNMRTLVNWVKEAAATKKNSQVLFYYSGHGSQGANEVTSLLPVDGSFLDDESGYSLSSLYSTLGAIPARNVCVFLDACFSGKQRDDNLLVASKGARRVKMQAPESNMVVFSAAQDKETAFAYPEKGHGLFTYFLLKKLQESKGDVMLGDLANYIEENVVQVSRIQMNAKQTPVTSTAANIANNWRKLKLSN